MAFFVGRDREARRAYGFDEIALVPGAVTVNPEEVEISIAIGNVKIEVPFLASAMDGVVDAQFAVAMGKLGGLAVLNLDGIHSRYENVNEVYEKIAAAPPETATELVQKLYKEPVKEKLIAQRVKEIKAGGVAAAVSCIPMNAEKFGPIAQEAGADLFVVQSTVATVRHIASKYKVVDLNKFVKSLKIPVIVGNTVSYARHARTDGNGLRGGSRRCRTGSRLHVARGSRYRCAASHGDRRLRGGSRFLL